HVADFELDPVRLPADVEAEAGAFACVRPEQAADHADGGRLAGSVGAEEANDLAAPHREIDVVDRRLAAEALGEAADLDDGLAVHEPAPPAVGGVTSTGWPTFSDMASPSGRASTRKTSFSRLSFE